MSATVLIVEDDLEVLALVRQALSSEGYVLVDASTLADGWRYFETLRPDIVIADVGLPDGTGLTLCERVRSHSVLSDTPFIILTGKDQIEDKERGFAAGADHYLTKPLHIKELRLWVASLLRRIKFTDQGHGILRIHDFVMDPQTHRVTCGEQAVTNLTRREFDLLYELVRQRPKVLSKQYILSALWNTVLRDNTVEVHVKNIRSKLGAAGARVVTVSGVGYRFD